MTSDPTPGDPDRVEELADKLLAFADDVADAQDKLRNLMGDSLLDTFTGETADAFGEQMEKVPPNLAKLHESHELAGQALATYWPKLRQAQADADRALDDAVEAQSDLTSAETWLETAASSLETAQEEAEPPDEGEVRAEVRRALTDAEGDHEDAQSAVTGAQGRLDAAKLLAQQAKEARQEAASLCVSDLRTASDAGIKNKKWWEKVVDWVADNWDTIVQVAQIIGTIVGIAALFIGGPLIAGILLAVALVALADTLVKYSKGEASLWDVGFAVLDVLPGGRLVGAGARTARTSLGSMAAGLRQTAGRARQGLGEAAQGTYDRMRNLIRRGDTDPVDMATGRMFLPQVDVVLPGTLPLAFTRRVESGYRAGFWFGPSWSSTLDQRLERDDEGIVFVTEDGMLLAYPHPEKTGVPVLPVAGPRWPLVRAAEVDGHGGELGYRVSDPLTGQTRVFSAFTNLGVAPLLRISDRNGNTIDIDYDRYGTPTALRHSGGYHICVETDTPGRVTALVLSKDDERIVLKKYGYTEGHLTEVVNSSGLPLRFAYDHRQRVTSWRDTNGHSYAYTYDERDRCVAEGGHAGHFSLTLQYDGTEPTLPHARVTTLTTAEGAVSRYVIDDHCNVITEIDPLGNSTHTTYDEYHHVTGLTDALGHTTRFVNNGFGQPVVVSDPEGRTTRYDYHESGRPSTVRLPDGSTFQYEFDQYGNCTGATDPGGATRRFAYDESGGLVARTDPSGATTRMSCNGAGLPVEITDPLGNRTVRELDAFGRETVVTDPAGAVTFTWWNVEGHKVRTVAPDGAEQTWAYDSEGNCLRHTDANGNQTTYTYGPFDTLTARTEPGGQRYEYAHDAALRVRRVTNPQGLTWDYTYDAAGRLVSETDFDGSRVTYDRDPEGRLTARTNALGQTTVFERDFAGRVTRKEADGASTEYVYDVLGRLARAENAHAALVIERDATGRVLSESCNGRVLRSVYDACGRRTHRITPSGASSEWGFDAAGRGTTLTTSGHTIAFERDAAGRPTTRRVDSALALTQTWAPTGRLTAEEVTAASGTAYTRSYDYRPDGHLAAVLTGGVERREFELDPAGRVTAVQADGWTEAYAYDEAGNQTWAEWPHQRGSADVQGEREYGGTRLTRAGRIRYEHDAAGRITMRRRSRLSKKPDVWRYTWDAEDRLASVITPDGTEWRYQYDPLGRRVAKQQLANDGSGRVMEHIDFAWDGSALVEQTVTASARHALFTITWDYEGLRPLAQTERMTDASTQQEIDRRFFAIVTDLVGTPSELIGEQGELAWQSRATLWGTTAWKSNASAFTPLRFPGQYHDTESGLHYNYHRYYDPATARYLSPDPLGLTPAPNPVTYVHNPHTWVDPLGLMSCEHPAVAETRQGRGSLVSQHPMTADEALQSGIDFLGDGYRELGQGRGVFRSSDGLRQFRMDQDSLQGGHWPDVPHVHFEMFENAGDKRPFVNNHVPLID
ncbi:DUF6531 domain-containing protein [Streptomyces sp. JH002]|uniref:RHS repeat-associated core domain-containing protein n=1 Tax=Streptomyces sp. JH002 TaxID=2763259 RepID=UPI003D801CF8